MEVKARVRTLDDGSTVIELHLPAGLSRTIVDVARLLVDSIADRLPDGDDDASASPAVEPEDRRPAPSQHSRTSKRLHRLLWRHVRRAERAGADTDKVRDATAADLGLSRQSAAKIVDVLTKRFRKRLRSRRNREIVRLRNAGHLNEAIARAVTARQVYGPVSRSVVLRVLAQAAAKPTARPTTRSADPVAALLASLAAASDGPEGQS